MALDSARGSTMRYGAPAAVVDPILSFLFDLRRMEATMLSALEHLGVQCERLPPPFGQSEKTAAASEATTKNGTSFSLCVSSTSANTKTPSTANAAASTEVVAPLDVYVQHTLGGAESGASPAATTHAAVQQVLAWLDAQPSMRPVPSATAASHALVSAFVAAGASHDAYISDNAAKTETHVRRPAKRHRAEASSAAGVVAGTDICGPVAEDAGGQEEEAEKKSFHLALSAAEVRAAADLCGCYERLLRSGTKELAATLTSTTTADLAQSYSCHAKWVEVAREDAKVKCVVPSSAALKQNYERLICLNDALATCQRAMHDAYVTMEECADVFLEEATVVAREEQAFQRCIAQAREECAALQDVRQRLKRTRQALERSIA